MQVTVTARHIELPTAIEKMLRTKLSNLERFGHKLISVHAIFGQEKYLYTAELTLAMKGLTLVGTAKHKGDLLGSMEEAVHKLKEQLRRHQSKQVHARRRVAHRPA